MDQPSPLKVTDETAAILNKVLQLEEFFPEFKADHATHLFKGSDLSFYPANYTLIAQGDTGRDIFIICGGSVSISKSFGGAGADMATLGMGDMFGEIALLQDGVRMATAVTAEDSQIYRLIFDDILYLLENNPELVAHLEALARKRLDA